MTFSCSTCLEPLKSDGHIVSGPCGHVFHNDCLSKWLATGKANCPQCRARCSEAKLRRIYLTDNLDVSFVGAENHEAGNEGGGINVEQLQRAAKSSTHKLKIAEEKLTAFQAREVVANDQAVKMRKMVRKAESECTTLKEEVSSLKTQMRYMTSERDEVDKVRSELKETRQKLDMYSTIDTLVRGSVGQVNRRLHDLGQYDGAARKWCVIIEAVKRDLDSVTRAKERLETDIRDYASTVSSVKQANWKLRQEIAKLKSVRPQNSTPVQRHSADDEDSDDKENKDDSIICLLDTETSHCNRPTPTRLQPSSTRIGQDKSRRLKRYATTDSMIASHVVYNGLGYSTSDLSAHVPSKRIHSPLKVMSKRGKSLKPRGVGRPPQPAAATISLPSRATGPPPSKRQQLLFKNRIVSSDDSIFLLDSP